MRIRGKVIENCNGKREPRRRSSRVTAATCPVSLVQCRPHHDNEPTGNGSQRKLHSRKTLFYFSISFLCALITLHYFLNLCVSEFTIFGNFATRFKYALLHYMLSTLLQRSCTETRIARCISSDSISAIQDM